MARVALDVDAVLGATGWLDVDAVRPEVSDEVAGAVAGLVVFGRPRFLGDGGDVSSPVIFFFSLANILSPI